MPTVDLPTGASIYYEEYGEGFPLLLFAPGGTDSRIDFWHRSFFDPTVELADTFRVIAMDQRNAGRSFGPLEATGWEDMAADQIALLDLLGIERAHLMGGCIGCSYCLRVIHDAPGRVTAAVLQSPIGLRGDNFDRFVRMFKVAADTAEKEGMAAVVAAAQEDALFQQNNRAGLWAPRIVADDAFREQVEKMDPAYYAQVHRETAARFFGRTDFVFSVDRDWTDTCEPPLLVLSGHDDFHPPKIAEEIADRALNAILLEEWDKPDQRPVTINLVRNFLKRNTPSS